MRAREWPQSEVRSWGAPYLILFETALLNFSGAAARAASKRRATSASTPTEK